VWLCKSEEMIQTSVPCTKTSKCLAVLLKSSSNTMQQPRCPILRRKFKVCPISTESEHERTLSLRKTMNNGLTLKASSWKLGSRRWSSPSHRAVTGLGWDK
jgi:hypothetical protein